MTGHSPLVSEESSAPELPLWASRNPRECGPKSRLRGRERGTPLSRATGRKHTPAARTVLGAEATALVGSILSGYFKKCPGKGKVGTPGATLGCSPPPTARAGREQRRAHGKERGAGHESFVSDPGSLVPGQGSGGGRLVSPQAVRNRRHGGRRLAACAGLAVGDRRAGSQAGRGGGAPGTAWAWAAGRLRGTLAGAAGWPGACPGHSS